MEPREGRPRITEFEITGPEFMEPEDNFFDQSPFRKVLSDAAGQDPNLLRQLRSGLRLGLELTITRDIEDALHASAERKKQIATSRYRKLIPNPPDEIIKLTKAFKAASEKLSIYPYWQDYVTSKCDLDIYTRDGSPKSKKTPLAAASFPPTYAPWVVARLKRENRIIALSVQQFIFPETSLQDVARATGKRRVNRTWKIRAMR